MSEEKIEYDCECKDCHGTGLYVGMGENDGAAVVCTQCKGTGCRHIIITYKKFKQRHSRKGVRWVYAANPGIYIGEGSGHTLEQFGGMPFSHWIHDYPFPDKSENRISTCPSWWYQTADYTKKPHWNDGEVQCCWGQFSYCKHFHEKSKCWARWDAEQKLASSPTHIIGSRRIVRIVRSKTKEVKMTFDPIRPQKNKSEYEDQE